MSATVTIYALGDDTGVRYVGSTINSVEHRLEQHLGRCGSEFTAKAAWLMELKRRGRRPCAHVLEVCAAQQAWERERHWILLLRAQGCALTNARTP